MSPLLLPTLMRFGLLAAARTAAPLASGTISRAGAVRLAMVAPMRMVTAPAMLAMTALQVNAASAAKVRSGSRTLMSAASPLEEQIAETIKANKIVVYSKSYCPFCASTKKLFSQLDVPFTVIELDEIDGGSDLQQALTSFSGQRTVPNVFVNAEHLGGNDDTQKAFRSGKLLEMIK